jgi:two-component system, cell cycle sensor histidine kinase and response regulator CckA
MSLAPGVFEQPDLRALFESAPGLYLVLTPDLRIVAVTDAYLAATMTTRDGILGRHLFDIHRVDVRNQLQEQLRQAQKMEAIGRLAGGIGHDFNNLLTVILGYGGILKEILEDGPAMDSVEQIEQAAARAAALTNQLLTFSRKQVLQLRNLDLNSVIGGMREYLQRLTGENVALEIDLDSDLPNVKADAKQMEGVIMNLAVNARDAMPTGGRLRIATRSVGADESGFMAVKRGRYAVISVSDTGLGMDAQTRERIFEPFFTTKESGKGTGLGLATVFGVVEQSGGTITVSSEPGQGATFSIFMPAHGEPVEREPAHAIMAQAQASAGTILLVDDEEPLRRLVRGILNDAGYEVLQAAAGEEALVVSRNYHDRIDLLLTDVVMPGMKGPDLAVCLQNERPGMAVLFMSGYDQNLMGQNLSPPANFLAKPFAPKSLAETVEKLLRQRRVLTKFSG